MATTHTVSHGAQSKAAQPTQLRHWPRPGTRFTWVNTRWFPGQRCKSPFIIEFRSASSLHRAADTPGPLAVVSRQLLPSGWCAMRCPRGSALAAVWGLSRHLIPSQRGSWYPQYRRPPPPTGSVTRGAQCRTEGAAAVLEGFSRCQQQRARAGPGSGDREGHTPRPPPRSP